MVKIVLSGGSVKGFCYIGLMKALQEIPQDITHFVGTSVGAFACMIIILRYNYETISEILLNFDPKKIISPKVKNLLDTGSLDKGIHLENFVKTFIKNKISKVDITLKELYEKTNINFVCCVTDVLKSDPLYINWENFPDMPVFKAVSASMRIPFLFENLLWEGIVMCDGALTSNTPIRYFKEDNEEDEDLLCFFFENEKDKTVNMSNFLKIPLNIISDFNREYAKKITKSHIISFEIPFQNSITFEISQKSKKDLIDIGYNETKKALQKL